MHKPTLFEFHDAVTTGAAQWFVSSEQNPGDQFQTIRDRLWDLLTERRWPIAEMIQTEEGQHFFDSLGQQAEEKVHQLTVDQQR